MAVVSPYLPHAQALGLGTPSQQADLLDALLASCQKSSMNPTLPGYGRILEPYFAADFTPPKRPIANSKVTAKGKGKGRKSKGKGNNVSASSSDEEAISSSKKPIKLVATSSVKEQAEQTIKAVFCQGDARTVWAGPTFGMAPSALEIPFSE